VTAPTTTVVATTTTRPGPPETGDVDGFELVEIEIDGEVLAVALADDRGLRARGLTGVEDLGDLAGMLFWWGEPTASVFTMNDTLIPLDIAFLDRDGVVLEVLEMTPCEATPCPNYGIDPVYWHALESPLGSLGLEVGDEVGLP
jgi:uncharacterized membrane protein (UPF0127 family)